MVCATVNGHPWTVFVSFYCPNNTNDETDITNFYNEISYLIRHISKHKVLIIGGNMNANIGKDGKNKAKQK